MSLRSFVALFLFAPALAACSAAPAAEPLGGSCETFQTTRVVEQSAVVALGTDFQIALCSNPSTGFTWDEPRVDDTTVIRLADRTYGASAAASSPLVGAAGGEILTIHPLKAGSTLLSIRYGQPWDGGTKGEWTYTLALTVQ